MNLIDILKRKMKNECPLVWVIIGVSGSGKTVIGRLFAEKLECDFNEGDRRHPLSNITKMHSHQPLNDDDRTQWLKRMQEDIQRAVDRNLETVVTCSALKVAYRQQLSVSSRVQLVWLDVPKKDLEHRLEYRSDHYMKSEMLNSQLESFEPITAKENVITLDGRLFPAEIVAQLITKATKLYPSLQKPWWERTF